MKLRRIFGWLLGRVPAVAATAALAFLVVIAERHSWSMPRFGELIGRTLEEPKDDWCREHNVPEGICVECQKDLMPAGKRQGWCRIHGVPECVLCHPELAQTDGFKPSTEALAGAAEAFRLSDRVANSSKCKLHERRLQFADESVVARLGIETATAVLGPVRESVAASGETVYDPDRLVRVSPRVPGTVWLVNKKVGDRVQAGEVLALVDSAEVGRAKAEYQHALVQRELKQSSLESLKELQGSVTARSVLEAGTAVEEARLRCLAAELELGNLGLRLPDKPASLAEELHFLGIPTYAVEAIRGRTPSNNLLAVLSPIDGEVVGGSVNAGEAAEPAKPLFTIADNRRLGIDLDVRLEDAAKVKVGQTVMFEHDGHVEGDAGTVAWISPEVNSARRMVRLRVDLPNAEGRHHASTFGIGRIVFRDELRATLVPASAVHWEGCCHVVFVRDRDYATGFKVFHVRKVRPGSTVETPNGPMIELLAGVLPGEIVATVNSGVMRSELLKNSLGDGCGCGK